MSRQGKWTVAASFYRHGVRTVRQLEQGPCSELVHALLDDIGGRRMMSVWWREGNRRLWKCSYCPPGGQWSRQSLQKGLYLILTKEQWF